MTTTSMIDPLLASTVSVFTTVLEPDKSAPTVDPLELTRPVIVRHVSERVIDYKRDGEARRSTLQVFASRAGAGAHFSVFSNTGLNSQLKAAGKGAVIALRYVGKEKNDERDVHVWSVTTAPRGAGAVEKLRATDAWKDREVEFDSVIQEAVYAERERLKERRASGNAGVSPEAPPHDDDDAPRY